MSQRSIFLSVAMIWASFGLGSMPAAEIDAASKAADPKAIIPTASNDSAALDRLLADEVFGGLPAGTTLAPRTSDAIFLRRVYLDLVGG